MPQPPLERLARGLEQRRADGLQRNRRIVDGPRGGERLVDGRRVLGFAGNDYLGLAGHPELVRALQRGADAHGVGSGAAHLIDGHSRAHQALEEELADFTGRPRALLFSTGYMANLGVISALCGDDCALFEDRLNHASLLDAGLLSRARFNRYHHADADDLERRLAGCRQQARMVVSDGVFSMDGDLAPLPRLAAVAADHNALLAIDDAHGIGVLGSHGGGLCEHYGLDHHAVPVLIGTFGKAFGTFGAFVAGDEVVIDYLLQHARTYLFTTAPPAALAEATRAALRLVREEGWRRERLAALIAHFRAGAARLGLDLLPSTTPIQPLRIGDSAGTAAIGAALFERGILVGAIRPPTVPEGGARLRITLSVDHREAEVDQLLAALDEVVRR